MNPMMERREALIDAAFAKVSRNPSDWEATSAWRDAIDMALRVGPDETGWQPIETAPLDGTRVDLWEGGRRMTNMHWKDGNWCWSRWSLGRPRDASKVHLRTTVYTDLKPTHWRLPPEPPEGI